jgi:hypothetical protein
LSRMVTKAEKSVAKLECAPEGGQRSGCGFAKLPDVFVLKLWRAQIAECRLKPAIVVDLLDEAGKVFCDFLEGFEDHRVDRLDLQRLVKLILAGEVDRLIAEAEALQPTASAAS